MKALRGPRSGFITGLAVSAGLAVTAIQPPMPTQAAGPSITISPSPVLVDSIAYESGAGFKPGEVVLLRENGILVGAPAADASGKFGRKVSVPTSVAEHPTVVFNAYGSKSKLSVNITMPVTTR